MRDAEHSDVEQIAGAVKALLLELGATPAPAEPMRGAVRALLEDPAAGALIVAEADGVLIGVLGASWQSAIHIPGRYGLIQDLWVHASWRSQAIGAALLARLLERARELGMARLEVGLPNENFAGLGDTESFYRANGFSVLGPRMRKTIA